VQLSKSITDTHSHTNNYSSISECQNGMSISDLKTGMKQSTIKLGSLLTIQIFSTEPCKPDTKSWFALQPWTATRTRIRGDNAFPMLHYDCLFSAKLISREPETCRKNSLRCIPVDPTLYCLSSLVDVADIRHWHLEHHYLNVFPNSYATVLAYADYWMLVGCRGGELC